MSLRISTNVTSLVAQRHLQQVEGKQSKTFQRLASGSRITSADDDAAGLALSERLRGTIASTGQAARNANDGISLIQTAEGALNELSNILIRLRELSVQASSDTVGPKGRELAGREFKQLFEEVDRIAGVTEFNGRKLLIGEGDELSIHIGVNADSALNQLKYDISESDSRTDALGLSSLNIESKEEAQDGLARIDEAIDKVSGNRATLGALQNRLNSTVRNLQISKENLSFANSQIRDADIAEESTELAKSNILMNAGISVLAQANTVPTSALKLIA